MKTFFTLFSLLLLMNSHICLAIHNPFKGTWQLVSGEYLNEEKELVNYSSLGISSQKVINQEHFSFVSIANGKFWAAGTGTYTFTDTEYIESPKMASYPLENKGVYSFKYEIKGDIWYNSRWHDDTRVEYEVWHRVK